MFYSQTQTTKQTVSNHCSLYDTHMMQLTRHQPYICRCCSPSPQRTADRWVRRISSSCVLGTGTGCLCRVAKRPRPRSRTKEALFGPGLWKQRLQRRPSHRGTPFTQESLRTRKALRRWHLYVFHTAVNLCARGSFKRSQPGSIHITIMGCSFKSTGGKLLWTDG